MVRIKEKENFSYANPRGEHHHSLPAVNCTGTADIFMTFLGLFS